MAPRWCTTSMVSTRTSQLRRDLRLWRCWHWAGCSRHGGGALAAIAVLLGVLVVQNLHWGAAPNFRTKYRAVVLTGGQVYYGPLENATGMYPILRDVFYVVARENPQTRQVTNVLVRRGKELHGPDFMMLNRDSILFVEPVGDESEIARSIAEQKKER